MVQLQPGQLLRGGRPAGCECAPRVGADLHQFDRLFDLGAHGQYGTGGHVQFKECERDAVALIGKESEVGAQFRGRPLTSSLGRGGHRRRDRRLLGALLRDQLSQPDHGGREPAPRALEGEVLPVAVLRWRGRPAALVPVRPRGVARHASKGRAARLPLVHRSLDEFLTVRPLVRYERPVHPAYDLRQLRTLLGAAHERLPEHRQHGRLRAVEWSHPEVGQPPVQHVASVVRLRKGPLRRDRVHRGVPADFLRAAARSHRGQPRLSQRLGRPGGQGAHQRGDHWPGQPGALPDPEVLVHLRGQEPAHGSIRHLVLTEPAPALGQRPRRHTPPGTDLGHTAAGVSERVHAVVVVAQFAQFGADRLAESGTEVLHQGLAQGPRFLEGLLRWCRTGVGRGTGRGDDVQEDAPHLTFRRPVEDGPQQRSDRPVRQQTAVGGPVRAGDVGVLPHRRARGNVAGPVDRGVVRQERRLERGRIGGAAAGCQRHGLLAGLLAQDALVEDEQAPVVLVLDLGAVGVGEPSRLSSEQRGGDEDLRTVGDVVVDGAGRRQPGL